MSELSDALRKYAGDLDMGRPLRASAICLIAVDGKGEANATLFGLTPANVPMRDVGISMCTLGIDRFLTRPLATQRGST